LRFQKQTARRRPYRQSRQLFKIYVYGRRAREARRLDTIVDLRLPPSAVASPTLRVITMKKFEGPSLFAGLWRVHATFPPETRLKSRHQYRRGYDETVRHHPPLPRTALALGAADMKLLEHVSAFTFSPTMAFRIDPHMIRRVTSYDGALLERRIPSARRRLLTSRAP